MSVVIAWGDLGSCRRLLRVWGRNGVYGDLTLGAKLKIQCTDDVFWNCGPEYCVIL